MKDFLKNKIVTILIVVATVILAGVAIFTAVRLYQLRKQAVAPTAPESEPGAQTAATSPCEELAFTITATTPTPTSGPTSTSTPTPTVPLIAQASPTPTTVLTPTSMPTPTSTSTATATPTTTGTSTSTPTSSGAELPEAGVSLPTILIGSVGLLLIILALIFAL